MDHLLASLRSGTVLEMKSHRNKTMPNVNQSLSTNIITNNSTLRNTLSHNKQTNGLSPELSNLSVLSQKELPKDYFTSDRSNLPLVDESPVEKIIDPNMQALAMLRQLQS